MRQKPMSKLLSIMLTLCLVLGMVPMTAFAEGEIPLGDSGSTVAPTDIVVAAIAEQPEETLYQGYDFGEITSQDEITLPETLTGTDEEDAPITIEGVTWESAPVFDPATAGIYEFSPVLPEGYSLAEGVTAPVITVILRPEGGVGIMPLGAGDYNTGDIAVINNIITTKGLNWTPANIDGSASPADWTVIWSSDTTNKRITLLDISGESLTGALDVSGLTALTDLYCDSNQLTSLDVSGLTALTYFDCYNNQLTSLGTLPTGLEYLNCSYNELTSLGTLPTGLTNLDCSDNELTSLGTLPTGLEYLNCSYNELTSLGTLPTGLTNLDCSDNELTSLGTLPTGLTWLNCSNNQLTSLGTLPTGLEYLACSSNQLTSLGTLPTGLTTLFCSYNELTSLGTLPTGLTTLYCSNNQLTSLGTLPTGLTQLNCNYNQLASLDVSGLTALTSLECYNNQLTNLDVSGLTELTTLYCNSNQLTSLGTLPTGLEYLDCSGNQLTSLDVSSLSDLHTLWCQQNRLPSLALSSAASYSQIDVSNNYMAGEFAVTGQNITWDGINFQFSPQNTPVVIPPGLTSGTVTRTSDTAATIGFTTDNAGTAYYIVQNSGGPTPTKADVAAGTSLGAVTVGANTGKVVTLTPGAKDIYVVVEDAGGDISEPLKIEAAAFTSSPLGISTGLAWDSTTPGKATWGAVANATGYNVQLYKDDMAEGTPVAVPTGTEYDFTSIIATKGAGSYTFSVQAVGDGITWSDGAWSSESAEYTPGAAEYNTGDIAVINNIISANGLNWTPANTDGSESPADWAGVTWSAAVTNKRITELNISSKSLTGTLDVSGLTALTDLYCFSNQLTSLGTLPTTLEYLNCSENQLTSLGTLPTGLEDLRCSGNQLTSLDVSGLAELTTLYCYNNQLTSLGTLPTGLEYLDCDSNQLTSLDVSGLTALTTLLCSDNQLTSLGTLPTGLTELYCYNNQLTSLGALPTGLKILSCFSNQLTSLGTLPTGLETLNCYNNQLTSLGTLPTGLTDLDCSSNQLTSLDISGLTELAYLSCYDNQLTSLGTLPTGLEYLDCDSNQLTSLDVSGLTALTDLICYNNQLTSLGTLPTGLEYLYCSSNQLTSLDVSGLSDLEFLWCSQNRLTGLTLHSAAPYSQIDVSNNYMANQFDVTGRTIAWDGTSFIFSPQHDSDFKAVTNIIRVPATATVGTPLTLTGTVVPSDADNQTITWSIFSPGSTGASISGDTFTATSAGSAVITATITDGSADGEDYEQAFNITVKPAGATTHAVTVSSAGTGASGSGNYAENATVTINAGTPPQGQQFKNWTVTSGSVTLADENSASTTFTMPASAVTVTANFELIPTTKYNITATNGTANPTSAAQGTTVTLTADAAPSGQRFKEWSTTPMLTFVEGTSIFGQTAKFTMPAQAVTVTATYEAIPTGETAVTGVALDKPSLSLYSNTTSKTAKLTVTVSPNNATDKSVTWKSGNDAVATVDQNGNVTAVANGKAVITVTTTDGGYIASCTVTVSSYQGGGGGNGGSGSDTTVTQSLPANKPVDITKTQATDAAKKAAQTAKTENAAIATVRIKNPGKITADALKAMAEAAGMPVRFQADSMSESGKAVDVRITLDPAKAGKELNLTASTTSTEAKSIRSLFEKYFTNKVRTIHLNQTEAWWQPVEIAAKVDLTGMDITRLVFYSYDKVTNTYKRINKPAYWIDKNGYLHFTTSYAGDIIISEGSLTLKKDGGAK